MVQHIGKYLPCVRLLPLLQLNSRLVGNSEVQSKAFLFDPTSSKPPNFEPHGVSVMRVFDFGRAGGGAA
jgi:hypothetical protein